MMALIRFWQSLTKKDNVRTGVLDMKYYIFDYFNSSFITCFSRIWIRIFLDRIRIFGRSGSGLVYVLRCVVLRGPVRPS